MKRYAGIDLHRNNCYVAVIDDEDQVVASRRQPNDLEVIHRYLAPHRDQLNGVVVESTFNWYWLVDGLEELGYRVHLANTLAAKQYEGLKYADDKTDAIWLARMLRLGILPTGWVCPKRKRAVRDLLRKRTKLVRLPHAASGSWTSTERLWRRSEALKTARIGASRPSSEPAHGPSSTTLSPRLGLA